MSSDRLRAAADRLDGSAEEFTAVTTQSKATAALLRAVADTPGLENLPRGTYLHAMREAAAALADTILGVEE